MSTYTTSSIPTLRNSLDKVDVQVCRDLNAATISFPTSALDTATVTVSLSDLRAVLDGLVPDSVDEEPRPASARCLVLDGAVVDAIEAGAAHEGDRSMLGLETNRIGNAGSGGRPSDDARTAAADYTRDPFGFRRRFNETRAAERR